MNATIIYFSFYHFSFMFCSEYYSIKIKIIYMFTVFTIYVSGVFYLLKFYIYIFFFFLQILYFYFNISKN